MNRSTESTKKEIKTSTQEEAKKVTAEMKAGQDEARKTTAELKAGQEEMKV